MLVVFAVAGMLTWTTAALGADPPIVTGGPVGLTNSPPSFTITGAPTGTVTWTLLLNNGQVNGGSGLGSVDTGTLDNGDGAYLLQAFQTVPDDPLGDTVGAPSALASASFNLDRVAPATPGFTQLPPAVLTATSATFDWINDGSSFQWQLTGGGTPASGNGPGPVAVSNLSAGAHTFSVTPTDAAGNTGQTASFSFAVDAIAPGVPAIAPIANNLTNAATQTLTWTGTEDGGTFTWRLTGPTTVAQTPLAATTSTGALTLLAGAYTFAVRQHDAANNPGAEASYAFVVDRVAPVGGAISHVPATNSVAGFSRQTTITVALAAAATPDTIDGITASGQTITYALTNVNTAPAAGSFSAWTVGTNRTISVPNTQGATTIFLWTRDAAGTGNVSAALPLTPAVVFDTVAPTVAATSFPVPGEDVTMTFGPLANVLINFSEAVQNPTTLIRMCIDPCGFPIAVGVTLTADLTGAMLDPFPQVPTAALAVSTRYEIELPNVRDLAGNSLSEFGADESWTFTTSSDGTPPGPVTGLASTAGIGQVALSWTRPGDADLARITVLRSTVPPASAVDATAARFSLPATAMSFTDVGLQPGVAYHYAVYTEDAVGNPSDLARSSAVPAAPPVAVVGTPPPAPATGLPKPPKTYRANLMSPRKGAVLKTLRPRLTWKRVKGATTYNVQIFDGKKKVVSAFTKARVYRVPKNRLKRGRRLTWHVWGYLGAKRKFVPRPMTSWFDTSKKAKP